MVFYFGVVIFLEGCLFFCGGMVFLQEGAFPWTRRGVFFLWGYGLSLGGRFIGGVVFLVGLYSY